MGTTFNNDNYSPDAEEEKNDNQHPQKNNKTLIRWIVGVFFAMSALVNGFHFSSFFLLVSAFLMFPLGFVGEFIKKNNLKSSIAIVLSVVLFFVGALCSPSSESIEDDPTKDSSLSQNKGDEYTNDTNSGNVDGSDNSQSNNDSNNSGDGSSDSESNGSDNNSTIVPDNSEKEEKKTYIVTFTAKKIQNNSVGDEWSKGIKFNDHEIKSGGTIEAELIGGLTLIAYAIESDNSKDDYGSQKIEFTDIEIGETETHTVKVIVKENDGRYSGNTAIWEFTVTIKRVA